METVILGGGQRLPAHPAICCFPDPEAAHGISIEKTLSCGKIYDLGVDRILCKRSNREVFKKVIHRPPLWGGGGNVGGFEQATRDRSSPERIAGGVVGVKQQSTGAASHIIGAPLFPGHLKNVVARGHLLFSALQLTVCRQKSLTGNRICCRVFGELEFHGHGHVDSVPLRVFFHSSGGSRPLRRLLAGAHKQDNEEQANRKER